MNTRICFDMDGTIADLYAVNGWLEMLRAYDAKCYEMAAPIGNFSYLARLLNLVQKNGYQLVIISWSSKCSDADFDAEVKAAKMKWLAKHLPSVSWDDVQVLPYGTNKSHAVNASAADILFDDEQGNRDAWNGIALTPDKIVEILKNLGEKGLTKPFPCDIMLSTR